MAPSATKALLGCVILSASLLRQVVADRTFYVWNKCSFTVWPAIYTDNSSTVKPDAPTGWEAPSNTWVAFTVPNNWTSGRIWGRTDCDFSGSNSALPESCGTGGCNGGLECDSSGGTGVPPASLAEWTLNGGSDLDWYDLSLVDGFNLPIGVYTDKGCASAVCSTNITASCPSALAYSGGGCLSSCKAGLDSDPDNSPNCCTGDHGLSSTCPSSGVQYYSTFKDACPDAYIYAYDDNSALRNCSMSLEPNYLLTFCPDDSSDSSSSASASGSDSAGASATDSSGSSATDSASGTGASDTGSTATATDAGSTDTATAAGSTDTAAGASSAGTTGATDAATTAAAATTGASTSSVSGASASV